MAVRPLDWRDLPALHRYRRQSIFLDSALILTRGPMMVPNALLSYLAPSMGVFTSVCNGGSEDKDVLIGQVIHPLGSQRARMTFLTPGEALASPTLPVLLDHLAILCGERGAFRLLAEVDECSPAFEAMRHASFAIYARQRVWQLTAPSPEDAPPSLWKAARSQDAIAIRSLYNNLVPGLVQQVEPFAPKRPHGLVYRQGDDLLAYVELRYGFRGIWAQPFVHPDAEDVVSQFLAFLNDLPHRRSRPVYICVRSYQSWLEPAIEELGAEPGPRQAVMVKHLAFPQRAVRVFSLPALEGGHAEVSAPLAHSESK